MLKNGSAQSRYNSSIYRLDKMCTEIIFSLADSGLM